MIFEAIGLLCPNCNKETFRKLEPPIVSRERKERIYKALFLLPEDADVPKEFEIKELLALPKAIVCEHCGQLHETGVKLPDSDEDFEEFLAELREMSLEEDEDDGFIDW